MKKTTHPNTLDLANYISVEYMDSKTVTEVWFYKPLSAKLIFDDNTSKTVNGLLARELGKTIK